MLLFLDESGQDHGESPYEVLAGVAISERNLWSLIQSIRAAELAHFGVPLRSLGVELKGKKLLKRKTFRHAGQGPILDAEIRRNLARSFLQKGHSHQVQTRDEFTAYGQTVLSFVENVLSLMAQYQVSILAAIVLKKAPVPSDTSVLRKDYSYLFERFFYLLEDYSREEMGLIVFDELERSQCALRIDQFTKYFSETARGYQRSSQIVPEPFFVHSELTTAIQLADIVAYCANWAIRINGKMTQPVRPELKPFGQQIENMMYKGKRENPISRNVQWPVYGIFYLDELRPKKRATLIEKKAKLNFRSPEPPRTSIFIC